MPVPDPDRALPARPRPTGDPEHDRRAALAWLVDPAIQATVREGEREYWRAEVELDRQTGRSEPPPPDLPTPLERERRRKSPVYIDGDLRPPRRPREATRPSPARDHLLSAADAAAYLHVSPRTVYKAISAGDLSAGKVGARFRIKPADLAAYLDKRLHRPVRRNRPRPGAADLAGPVDDAGRWKP